MRIVGLILGIVACFGFAYICWMQFFTMKRQDEENVDLSRALRARGVTLPTIFDELAILNDLQRLADDPGLVSGYFVRLRQRFITNRQIARLREWETLITTATSPIDALTKLVRAQTGLLCALGEQELIPKEHAVRSATLDADEEEQHLRKDIAAEKRRDLAQPKLPPPRPKSKYEQKIDDFIERERQGMRGKIYIEFGRRLASKDALDHWRNEQELRILESDLTPAQKQEQLAMLKEDYEEAKQRLSAPIIDIFKD
jgi:hypothetical protein